MINFNISYNDFLRRFEVWLSQDDLLCYSYEELGRNKQWIINILAKKKAYNNINKRVILTKINKAIKYYESKYINVIF